MTAIRRWRGAVHRDVMCCAAALSLALAGCVPQATVGTGAFRNAAAVTTQLQRGVSTKADVQTLLGVPNGSGAAVFRNASGGLRDIWYYEDIEATDMASKSGVMTMTLRQQILLVFFKGDAFDGYLWTTNSAQPAPR